MPTTFRALVFELLDAGAAAVAIALFLAAIAGVAGYVEAATMGPV